MKSFLFFIRHPVQWTAFWIIKNGYSK